MKYITHFYQLRNKLTGFIISFSYLIFRHPVSTKRLPGTYSGNIYICICGQNIDTSYKISKFFCLLKQQKISIR